VKVVQVDTLRLGEFPNLLWVGVQTDDGLVGLGETFFGAQAVEGYIHETAAPYLLGRDPLQIERHARALRESSYLGAVGSGAETRGRSAVDIALWDLWGRATGQPLYQLLGGASRERIRIYNTCAGYRYVRDRPRQAVDNWGLPEGDPEGPYEDLDAFLDRADELAHSLLEQGITGMKIWPFDPYAEQTGGQYISNPDLDRALEPFRKIRAAVGSRMDVMVEFHALWNLPMACKIARALEEFEPFWFEDPVRVDDLGMLERFARATRVPVAASEILAGQAAFRELLERVAVGVVIFDVSWTGGLTEAKRVAALAETHGLPIAPHDCTGPVVLAASTHLSVSAPNALVQETVRASYTSWYRDLVTALPPIVDGHITPLEGPGLGLELVPDLERRPDAVLRSSTLE
jgi:L-alanine-DL-glutamate epimerase-like enolase superfamily enzyme